MFVFQGICQDLYSTKKKKTKKKKHCNIAIVWIDALAIDFNAIKH